MILNVCTPGALDPADSFGLIAIELGRHLQRLGNYVNLYSLGPREVAFQDAEIAALIRQPVRAGMGGIFGGYPTTHVQYPNPLLQMGPRVAVTMFESSKIPEGWDRPLNACSAIVTPCRFCRDIFREAGVTVPIHVIPLGVNEIYRPAPRCDSRPFTFLAFIDRGLRKGGIQAMDAFIAAFGDDTGYKLILKGRKSKINATILNPNIELIQEDYSETQMRDLFYRADAMIANTRGEGFGLLPRQAAACGCIALATNFAGTADDIDAWGVPLPCRRVRADWSHHGRLSKMDLGEWAEVDTVDLVAMLRDVANRREEYQARAQAQAPAVGAMYTWGRFAQGVLDVWKEVS